MVGMSNEQIRETLRTVSSALPEEGLWHYSSANQSTGPSVSSSSLSTSSPSSRPSVSPSNNIFSEFLYLWSETGYGSPPAGSWRRKSGELIEIVDMTDSHLLNSIKMVSKIFLDGAENTPIYKNLFAEAQKRGIADDIGWDS
jgi:hypothetical protein